MKGIGNRNGSFAATVLALFVGGMLGGAAGLGMFAASGSAVKRKH